jgi:hypothetical protein
VTTSQGAPVPVLFLKREPDTPPAGWNEGMEMIADTGLSPCGKIGLHLGCLLRGNLFRPLKARFHWSGIKRAIKEALRP